jgi:hypothetical protein
VKEEQEMTIKRIAAVVILAISSVVAVQAQMSGQTGGMGSGPAAAPAAAPASTVDPAKSFDASVSQIERLWTGAAQAMPADKYGFAPSAAIFVPGQTVKYDGVRTFAQIVTHTIQANYMYFSMIGGIKPDVDTAAIAKLTSKDDIVKALADTFAFAHKAVANVTAANAFDALRGTQTRATMLAGAVGHANDEYGQAVEYLRMNGIVPPASEGRRGM